MRTDPKDDTPFRRSPDYTFQASTDHRPADADRREGHEAAAREARRVSRSQWLERPARTAGEGRGVRRTPSTIVSACSMVALAIVAGGCVDSPPTLEQLLEARFLEPRLSLTAVWSLCEASEREGGASPYCEGVERDPALQATALQALSTRRTTTRGTQRSLGDRHGVGLWSLAFGDLSSIDSALPVLREVAEDSEDSAAWNDLGVAYFVRARLRESPVDLVSALESVERAAALSPDDAFVVFNQAFLRQELHLLSAAEEAWLRYLEVDPSSPWSAEAAGRLDAVRTTLARGDSDQRRDLATATDRQLRRHYLQEELLGEWARARTRDPGRADELLAEARARADALAAETGDQLLADTVDSIERASGADDGGLAVLVDGHEAYARAVELIGRGAFAEARPLLESAGERLRAMDSPFAPWVDFHLLHCTYQEMRLHLVEELGQALLLRTRSSPVSAVRGRAWWLMGTARFLDGDLRGAVTAYSHSLSIFDRLDEVSNAMVVRSLLASVHDWLGQIDQAWALRYEVLRHLGSGTDPRLRRLTALEAAFAARDLGEPAAAAVFQQEVVLLAQQVAGDPLPLANALLKRAEIVADLRPEAALADLERAEELAQSIAGDDRRAVTTTQVLIARGRVLREREPRRAVEDLERALDLSGRKLVLFRPEISASMARAFERLGETASAERELRSAIDDLGRLRRSARSDSERIHLSARADAVQDDLVRLLFAQGREDEALLAAHAARSQSLLDRSSAVRSESATPQARPTPQPGEALVTFQVHEDRVTVWVVDELGRSAVSSSVSSRLICSAVEDLHRRIELGRSVDEELARLHQHLIAPIEERLVGIERLTLFPDDCLYLAPFAALLDASSGTYLVERFEISVLPSFALLRAQRAREARPSGAPRLLAIGDPAFDEGIDPRLERLAGAREEVSAIQLHYGDSTILFASAATPSALLEQLAAHDVVHVAAHAVDGGRFPLEAAVLLSPEGEAPGLLRARQLAGRDYRHLRLVVLAACRTSGPVAPGGEGPVGLAWPFLAGGADAVVATLWPIDDRATARLLPALHAAYTRTGRPAAALRQAQVEALRNGSPAHEWAGVVLFSGDE